VCPPLTFPCRATADPLSSPTAVGRSLEDPAAFALHLTAVRLVESESAPDRRACMRALAVGAGAGAAALE
jgi:hypothetical protein